MFLFNLPDNTEANSKDNPFKEEAKQIIQMMETDPKMVEDVVAHPHIQSVMKRLYIRREKGKIIGANEKI